jgi:hypothetical protein
VEGAHICREFIYKTGRQSMLCLLCYVYRFAEGINWKKHKWMGGMRKNPFDYERCALRIEKEKKILGDESS